MKIACPKSCNVSIRKDGFFKRKEDSKQIQRYRCNHCGKKFSTATSTLTYRQNKRRVNSMLGKLLASGMSMRRCALVLGINRKTVERKFEYLAKVAKLKQDKLLKELAADPVTHLQFDDMITSEHTKLKPLSISVAVDAHERYILDLQVSQIPAFGHLAKLSRQKYGKRKSELKQALEKLFSTIHQAVSPYAEIRSDEYKLYSEFTKKFFPKAEHKRYKGQRGCVAGQGELKKVKHDPLFMVNHTCAMLRANINRLIRRTWCTTKKAENLQKHLTIYMSFHNEVLI